MTDARDRILEREARLDPAAASALARARCRSEGHPYVLEELEDPGPERGDLDVALLHGPTGVLALRLDRDATLGEVVVRINAEKDAIGRVVAHTTDGRELALTLTCERCGAFPVTLCTRRTWAWPTGDPATWEVGVEDALRDGSTVLRYDVIEDLNDLRPFVRVTDPPCVRPRRMETLRLVRYTLRYPCGGEWFVVRPDGDHFVLPPCPDCFRRVTLGNARRAPGGHSGHTTRSGRCRGADVVSMVQEGIAAFRRASDEHLRPRVVWHGVHTPKAPSDVTPDQSP